MLELRTKDVCLMSILCYILSDAQYYYFLNTFI